MTKVWHGESLVNQSLKHFGRQKFANSLPGCQIAIFVKLVNESLANFTNLPILPNFSHAKFSLFTV